MVAQVLVAGALQRAVERNCAAPAALPEGPERQERWLAAGRSLANLLRVRHQATHLSLPSAQWHFAIRPQFLRRRFRDFLRRRDKSLL